MDYRPSYHHMYQCRSKFRPSLYATEPVPSHASNDIGDERNDIQGAFWPLNPFDAFVQRHANKLPQTDVLEMWFSGCHSGKPGSVNLETCLVTDAITVDVGGGNLTDEAEHDLARISFRWMVREIYRAISMRKCSIIFDPYELYEAAVPVRDNFPEVPAPFNQETPAPFVQDGPASYIQEGPGLYPWDLTQVFQAINTRLQDEYDGVPTKSEESYEGPLTAQDKQDAIQPLHNKLSLGTNWAAPFWWFQELWFAGYYNHSKQQKSYK